ncbi:MAG: chromosome segregation protein SMC [Pseudomonadota bacterium]
MRLEKIKLAGFKSFVDPTTVPFPSYLVGIVGPNGCGKSNVIDAVRWVMGESSAKMLRGESMEDVIFNGSASRKPVGTATIELIFDNSAGRAGGQYAQFNQISVKRQVSRDGQSTYFLNNVRCRRKDITDLFLGTGLGPRSYSIIEQGMISRIIEARPEELRVYLEEAAGISRYKERRRETENRIRHTRDNLDRLDDLIEEVEKQLKHLERQAATAEKYTELKGRERRANAELLALRWRVLDTEKSQLERSVAEQTNRVEATVAEQRRIESEIEGSRAGHAEANDNFNAAQGHFYSVGAEIARLEEAVRFARENRSRQQSELTQVEQGIIAATEELDKDSARLEESRGQVLTLEPRLEGERAAEQEMADQLAAADQRMQAWQSDWDQFNQEAVAPAQVAQVERTRINHLEEQDKNLDRRLARIEEEQAHLDVAVAEDEIRALEDGEKEAMEQVEAEQLNLSKTASDITGLRDRIDAISAELENIRAEHGNARGRVTSLETLQQAALGGDDEAANAWLAEQDLAGGRRLAELLSVDAKWRLAVETVLGFHLQAVCVERLDGHLDAVEELQQGKLEVREITSAPEAVASPGTLASKVSASWPVGDLLAGVRLADSVEAALAGRADLKSGESLITPEGVWVARHWVRFGRSPEAALGVLAREEEMRHLQDSIAVLEQQLSRLGTSLDEHRQELQSVEAARDRHQAAVDEANLRLAEIRSQLSAKRSRLDHLRQRLEALSLESREVQDHRQEGRDSMDAARHRLHAALEQIEEYGSRRETLIGQRDELRRQLGDLRNAHAEKSKAAHELALQLESVRSQQRGLTESSQRLAERVQELSSRRGGLEDLLGQGERPIDDQQQTLDAQLALRVAAETDLANVRNALQAIEHQLRELEQDRSRTEHAAGEQRTLLEQLRMRRQEFVVRESTLEERLAETDFERGALLEELPEDAEMDAWENQCGRLAQRIARLGAINLAAIDEFKEQSERMEYLGSQRADVTASLETLENAIRKIDRETRTRFKETFDKVDAGIKSLFPRLFGGGHAYLELTGEDLLDTGISVMARPPGKRNTSIHLLSGGEKALTAVALVFAIFQLNPAPFCMLDEVDAPLDDSNVGRFCDLVRDMSDKVQFIFITHNKITMELSRQLMGVTMDEPGVSRLVSVDIEEAAQMAAV